MKQLLNIIKKSFLWSYGRNTWQWDVLCVLILIFIFLSPKSWFVSGEPHGSRGHQSGAQKMIVGAEVIANGTLEQRVHALPGQARAQIISKRAIQDDTGKTVAYEVDFR